MVRHAIRAGFIETYRLTLNDCTDFERSPKPNGTPIFCPQPQQILEHYFPPVKHPKGVTLGDVYVLHISHTVSWGYFVPAEVTLYH